MTFIVKWTLHRNAYFCIWLCLRHIESEIKLIKHGARINSQFNKSIKQSSISFPPGFHVHLSPFFTVDILQ